MEDNLKAPAAVNDVQAKRALLDRIERLEFCIVLMLNQLRSVKDIPTKLIDNIESILMTKGKK